MLVRTPTQITSTTLGFEQFFKSIYETEFRDKFDNEIDWHEHHVYFVTLTINPHMVSLEDRLGLSKRACFYQRIINDGETDWFRSKSEVELSDFANDLEIADAKLMTKKSLIEAISDKITPKQRTTIASKSAPMDVFEHYHYLVARACLGNNIDQKRDLQPFAIAWIDFEGTRNGASVDPLTSTWPHIHAVIFVRSEHQAMFELETARLNCILKRSQYQTELANLNTVSKQRALTLVEDQRRLHLQTLLESATQYLKGDIRAARDIKIDRYNRNDGPLSDLIGYSKKGADKVPVQFVRKGSRWCEGVFSGADDLYQIFPRQD